MRHFYRSHMPPAEVLAMADKYFSDLGLTATATAVRARAFTGPLGSMKVSV